VCSTQRFCVHTYYGRSSNSQILAGLYHSVLCFSFTHPGSRELREREKEKKKKKQRIRELSDPVPSW
jgi:hypothetical protein